MITVYIQPGCPPCVATKRMLQKLGIAFTKVDVSANSDAMALIVGMGFNTTPVVISDDIAWSGFRPDRIQALV